MPEQTTQQQHTPGPWTVVQYEYDDGIERPIVTAPAEFCTICEMGRDPTGHPLANARLIAAAPALLEACNYAWQAFDDADGAVEKTEAMEKLRAAIAAAGGAA